MQIQLQTLKQIVPDMARAYVRPKKYNRVNKLFHILRN
jgi:hypothetical protein